MCQYGECTYVSVWRMYVCVSMENVCMCQYGECTYVYNHMQFEYRMLIRMNSKCSSHTYNTLDTAKCPYFGPYKNPL